MLSTYKCLLRVDRWKPVNNKKNCSWIELVVPAFTSIWNVATIVCLFATTISTRYIIKWFVYLKFINWSKIREMTIWKSKFCYPPLSKSTITWSDDTSLSMLQHGPFNLQNLCSLNSLTNWSGLSPELQLSMIATIVLD